MTDLAALRALHDAVKAGTATTNHYRTCWPGYMGTDTPNALNAARAAEGSLDAAHALHKAVLPGWTPSIGQNVWHKYWFATVMTTDGDRIGDTFGEEHADTPARAWLLAVLSALIAMETGNE